MTGTSYADALARMDRARDRAFGQLDAVAGSATKLLADRAPGSELARTLVARYAAIHAELDAARAQFQREMAA